MVPGKFDIKIYRGSTYDTQITAKSEDGSAMDFGAYDSMRMQVRTPGSSLLGADRPDPLMELTTGNGMLVVAGDDLSFRIVIDSVTSADLPFSEGEYDIELVKLDPGNPDIVDKILYGGVFLLGEVTI